MYQVLALDLDGTVLNGEQSIHPEVKAAIREAKEKMPCDRGNRTSSYGSKALL